jgi:CheY-like chemotaxis protein
MKLAQLLKPEVIIIDAELPGDKIGWEIMRALKLDEATRHIALISCSWLDESEVRSLVGDLAGHLQKPDFPYDAFEQIMRTTGVLPADRKNSGPPASRSDGANQFRSDLQTKGKRL